MALNKVVLLGTLSEDPKVSWTPAGTAECALTVLLEEPGKDGATFKLWTPVVLYGKAAEAAGETLNKGDLVLIADAKLCWRSWINKKTGEKEGKLAVMAWSVSKVEAPTPAEVAG
jgi:single-strand DNA-binding protein